MASMLVINVRVSVEDCDPDGRACECCGDVPYLVAAELVAWVGGKRSDPGVYLCGNCAEMIEEQP